MLENYRFSSLFSYSNMKKISQSSPDDDHSIMKSFYFNIVYGKSNLINKLGYSDEDKIIFMFKDIPDVEITSNSQFSLGNENTGMWLDFSVNEDGTFNFVG